MSHRDLYLLDHELRTLEAEIDFYQEFINTAEDFFPLGIAKIYAHELKVNLKAALDEKSKILSEIDTLKEFSQ